MKGFIFILIALTLFLLPSCRDHDQPNRGVFSISLNADVGVFDHEVWVIVRDHSSGDLIGCQQVTPGPRVEFDSRIVISDNKIDVIYFSNFQLSGNGLTGNHQEINAYLGVYVGSEWTLTWPSEPGSSPSADGYAEIHVDDLPEDYSQTASDLYGDFSPIADYTPPPNGHLNIQSAPIRAGSSTMIAVHPGYGNPKYTTLELQSGHSYFTNYADFKDFDKIVTFTPTQAQGILGVISAFDKVPSPGERERGYLLFFNVQQSKAYDAIASSIPRESLSLGYLNAFPYYTTEISSGGFHYLSAGPAPASIDYVDASEFTINNNSLDNFSVTTDRETFIAGLNSITMTW
jgi:hypothetical protein